VPPTRSDRRLLVYTSVALVLAGVLFAAAVLFATRGEQPSQAQTGPLYLGPATDLRAKINLGSPLYFANPFGGNGFWLDKENGALVALDVMRPGTQCAVRWRGSVNSYVDCNGAHLTKDQLARHPVGEPTTGKDKGGVFVDLQKRLPAPSA
jgi:hypothetical protein